MSGMDDTIEVCSGCGKMPRAIDTAIGSFICSRCGNNSTIFVTAKDYEKVVTELDQRFHQGLQNKKMEEAYSIPIKFDKKVVKKPNKAANKKNKPKKSKPKIKKHSKKKKH
jgi:predicted RNA-binding Zn-ribbon protein involved in translation (DUF1610 family)